MAAVDASEASQIHDVLLFLYGILRSGFLREGIPEKEVDELTESRLLKIALEAHDKELARRTVDASGQHRPNDQRGDLLPRSNAEEWEARYGPQAALEDRSSG